MDQQQPQQNGDSQPESQDQNQPCRFFAAGNCRYGQSCRYSHNDTGAMPSVPLHADPSPPPSSIACKFFSQGNCKFGNKCRFHHSQQALNRNQNRLNTPAPAPGSPCRFFSQGRCRFGQDCRFSHDLSLAQAYGGPQGYPYGHLMDPAVVAQVEAELAMEAELDAAIEATIDAQIRAEYENASLEEEAALAHEEMLRDEDEREKADLAAAQANGEVNTVGEGQPQKSG